MVICLQETSVKNVPKTSSGEMESVSSAIVMATLQNLTERPAIS